MSMSYREKFGSTPNLAADNRSARDHRGSLPDRRMDSFSQEAQDVQSHRGGKRGGRGWGRGRGRGGQGRGGRKSAGHRGDSDKDVDSEDSDGTSSVNSEPQFEKRRGGGRGNNRSWTKRRGQQQNNDKGSGYAELHHSYGDLRALSKETPETQTQQEIHIHYHGPLPSPSQYQQINPSPLFPNQNFPVNQFSGQCFTSQLGQPVSHPYQKPPGNVQHNYPPANTQNYFSPPHISPMSSPGAGYQGLPTSSNRRPAPPSLPQPEWRQTAWTEHGAKPTKKNETDWKKEQNVRDKKQQEEPAQAAAVPNLSPDEWIKVFHFLLRQFNGRTKLGTLMSQKGEMFKGLSHAQAAAWLKHCNRFLTFEKDGQIKFVSINFREARMCFKYKKHNTDKCENDKCPFFHICRDFIAGVCPREPNCHFNHSFHTKSNASVCAQIGLQAFTDEEIRMVVYRSTPVVCDKFNSGNCNEDCPDLHVCAQFVRNNCSEGDCRFGHSIKAVKHNNWILETFHMRKITEAVIFKMIISPRLSMTGNDVSENLRTAFVDKGAIPKNPKEKIKTNPKSQHEEMIQNTPSQAHTEQKLSHFAIDKERQEKKPNNPRDRNNSSGIEQNPVEGVSALIKKFDMRKGTAGPSTGQLGDGQREHQAPQRQSNNNNEETQGLGFKYEEGGQQTLSASLYSYLCENYTWRGDCSRKHQCPHYHHPERPACIWQVHISGQWKDIASMNSAEIEERFCELAMEGLFQVLVDGVGVQKLHVDFNTMTAAMADTLRTSPSLQKTVKIRRWSTRSYVDAEVTTPFNYYTQWVWYRAEGSDFQPLAPESLQFTVEEKYCGGQHKYNFQVDGDHFTLLLQQLQLDCINMDCRLTVLRRPFRQKTSSAIPLMCPLLLSDLPAGHHSGLPEHWCNVDHYQDYEMVELDTSSSEYKDAAKSFHLTLSLDCATIVHIFRVQNPSLWDKYCSTKRAMTRRNGSEKDADERKLFHGTPTQEAVHGICANNMDFRLSGANVGALYGRGSYFSANAFYSHSYTRAPNRFMFLARVLVGKFTKGHLTLQRPPMREGMKPYDSCVDDEDSPTIFVIFDLAQSYPEYLIQYKDAGMVSDLGQRRGTFLSSGRGGSTPSANKPVPAPRPRSLIQKKSC